MKICLVSIVKDEEKVILRMLNSVASYVDEFVIVDTGSSDKTINVCEDFFIKYGFKGKVFSRPWKNFGFNKTEALQIAEKNTDCDYFLFMDADNYIIGNFKIPENLTADGYLIKQNMLEDNFYWRIQLFKKGLNWEYKGVLHEVLVSNKAKSIERLEGDYLFKETHEGSRNTNLEEKYKKDISVLKKGLIDEPNNARYLYYLGQSYYCLNDKESAAYWYLECSKHSKWDEEIFYSIYLAGCCYIELNLFEKGKPLLYKSWNMRKSRLESVHVLIRHYYNEGLYQDGYELFKLVPSFDVSDDILFVEKDVYEWKIYDYMSLICYHLGKFDEARFYFEKMRNVPSYENPRLNGNKKFFYM